jgi:REP element-mobilizing transposase RayT
MSKPIPLQFGSYYHIFNRGNNRANLFIEERNFSFFLQKYWQHISPIADTFAFCLLWNHFHLLVRVKTEEEQREAWAQILQRDPKTVALKSPSQQFSNLFNAYAKAINKTYARTGCVFEHPFHRIEIASDPYFARLVRYIHRNPERYGFVADFRDWPHSSYHLIGGPAWSPLRRDMVIDWFDTLDGFEQAHRLEDNYELPYDD